MLSFKELDCGQVPMVRVVIDGVAVDVRADSNVAAALLAIGGDVYRVSAVSGMPRAPYCMMGRCYECLVEIDGTPDTQGCMVRVAEGMQIRRQCGSDGLVP